MPLSKRFALIAFLASLNALLVGSPGGADEVKLNGHVFTLPAGFEIEQAAGPGLVDRPIVADFDEQGRLYVADSSGSNDKVQVQLEQKPHRIVRLEDIDGDGRFDRRTVFADRMMFPEGVMWFDGSLYVAAPPSIWKLTDADGDGVAERREEWFQGKTLTGCANDLHGPYLGPDGWIYWCKGAFAEQTYERPGKAPWTTKASHIFRCRPDGSGIEPVMTGGMDNPVDVVFTPGGERVFTTTFLQHPGGGLRDGLIHAIYGGVYGKVHGVLDGHPRTGEDVMPVLVHLGPAAPCGLARYESDAFGADYQDNLFAACFNMQKITRHALKVEGAMFQPENHDFLVSNQKDFHPTDVFADADGSLIVVDTGGWYKLCCPTSQLHKPDVLGAVYRIKRSGAPRVDDPRGLQLDWSAPSIDELSQRLADRRPAVRRRAIEALGRRGEEAVPALMKVVDSGRSPAARLGAVWAATRIDAAQARGVARTALADDSETVRQAALHSTSVRRDREALPQLLAMLKNDSAQNRRAAAEALGRLEDKTAVPALLAAAAEPVDRALEHSLTYALIEIADPEATREGLNSPDVLSQRAALVALDQMPEGGLTAGVVAPYLASANLAAKQTAAWIVGRRPQWGGALAEHFRQRLASPALGAEERAELELQLSRLAGSAEIQSLLAARLEEARASQAERLSALKAMSQSKLKELPPAWTAALMQTLSAGDADLLPATVAAVRAFSGAKTRDERLVGALLKVGEDGDRADELRVAALAAAPGGIGAASGAVFEFLTAQLDAERPVAVRLAAVEVLSKAKLDRPQLLALAGALRDVGPLEVDRLLAAFEQTTDAEVGLEVVAALDDSPGLSALRAETLKPRLAKYPAAVQAQAEKLYARLDVGLVEQRAKLEELLAGLPAGDIRRGQAVFNSTKAACSSCHAIGYLGGRLGPDLTRIGQVRQPRDLLEAIVYPSASLVRSFEPMLVVTEDGRTFMGLLREDGADEVVLAKGPTEEFRIARDNIEEMRPGTVSIMPQGLDQQLSQQDLADLVTFLRACK